jgi:protein O-mannosyl-transferase
MRTRALLGLICALLVGAVYANSFASPFHFDDFHSVSDNVWIRSLANVPRFFTDVAVFSPLQENRAYRPILLIGFAISHAIGGGALWGYHLVTILLHAIGAIAVGLLARRLFAASGVPDREAEIAAIFAGAIFAVHSLLSEPVNYISARSSLQAAVLAVASVHAHVKGREEGRPGWLAWSWALLLLGMATKIIAMTVPVIIVAWEVLLGPRERDGVRAWALRLAPVFAIAIGFTALHELIVGEGSRAARSTIAPWSYLLTETQVWLRYIGLFVWPEDLNADLTMPWAQSIWTGPVMRSILANAAIVVFAITMRRRAPAITFGVIWYYVALAPTNSLAPLSEPASEHRVYIAAPGLVFAAIGLVLAAIESGTEELWRRRARVAIACGALAVIALGVRTHYRNRVWQSDLLLWGDVVAKSPDNGRAHLNFGLAKMSRGDLAGARESFDKCAAVWPGYSFCYINRAVLALHERRLVDAEREIGVAERLAPGNVYVILWRGEVERGLERWDKAEAAYRRVLEIAPGHAGARRGLAFAAFMQGRLEEAEAELLRLEAEREIDADGLYALGFLADRRGDRALAVRRYLAALAQDSRNVRARYNLAVAYQMSGDLAGAIREYRVLVNAGTADPDALFNLALALSQNGELAEAQAIKGELMRRAPTHPGIPSLRF